MTMTRRARHFTSRRLGALAGTLAAATALSACAPLLLGGAMFGGTMMVVDRRTSGTQIEDEGIELKGMSRVREVMGNTGHVNITSYNRQVLLTGEVPTENDKSALEAAMGRTENLRTIVNDLAVMSPSSLGGRSNDTLITSKVKASLVDAKDLISTAFKVVTERSVVYLMGRVTEREANRAADVARGVPGVEKVVKVFDVISEGELAGQMPAK
jgi:osmotically-inducible protein OsmY